LYARRPLDRVLYLKADSALAFGVIEAALSRARGAGVRVVAIVTEKRTRRRDVIRALKACPERSEGRRLGEGASPERLLRAGYTAHSAMLRAL